MTRMMLFLMSVLLVTISLACASKPKQYVPNDPVKIGLVPEHARLVGETRGGYHPLLFVAPEDGTVYYFANDELLATIGVQRGQKVEMNEMQGGSTQTVISIIGKAEYKTGARAAYNRLYFAPAAKPLLTATDR